LSAQAPDQKLFVDDVVTALTGTVDASGSRHPILQDQMRRATEEFDLRTAEAFARALLEALCQEPIDPRRLEALLILGLAHPSILDRHRISLQKEGERLAAMLSGQGQHDRARTLLAVIENAAKENAAAEAPTPEAAAATEAAAAAAASPIAQLEARDHAKIESLLRQADDAAAQRRTGRAIQLLQQVIALDGDRRDVGRMIRDLRWQEQEGRARTARRLKFVAFILVLGAGIAGLVWRENQVQQRFGAIPAARDGDMPSMRARLTAIDELVAEERVWFAMASAISERTDLQRELAQIEARAAAKKESADREAANTARLAEATRERGMLLAKKGQFGEALVELRRSLDLGGANWPARRDVESNVAAISEWIAKNPEREGQGR
jgi:hypothetical protein